VGNFVVTSDDEINADGNLNWRNNNPGNLVPGSFSNGQGAIGDNQGFAIFPTWDVGWDAMINLLETSAYQDQTIAGALRRWAPPASNPNINTYINYVGQQLGVNPNTTLVSSLTSDQLQTMGQAISNFEGGRIGTTYSPDDDNLPYCIDQVFKHMSDADRGSRACDASYSYWWLARKTELSARQKGYEKIARAVFYLTVWRREIVSCQVTREFSLSDRG
jgi:hypothetical protein